MQWFYDLIASEHAVDTWREKGRVDPLIRVLCGGREEMKAHAEAALGEIGPAAIPKLLKASRRHGYGVLTEAGAAMGMMGVRAVPPLIEALEGENDRWVAKAIAIALGAIGDAGAVPALIDAMRRIDELDAIPEALGRIRDWRAADPLIEAYLTTKSDSYREYVKRALMKTARAIPAGKHGLKERIDSILTVRHAGGQKRGSKPSSAYAPVLWETVADSFIAEADTVPEPDFRKLQKSLSDFYTQQQHDGWARVASSFRQKDREMLAFQCFIQGVVCNPDPESDIWMQIKLSPILDGNKGFMQRLADLPRLRGSGSEPDLPVLAKDLQIRFGFPGTRGIGPANAETTSRRSS